MSESQHTIQDVLSLEYTEYAGEIDEAVARVLSSGRYVLGPELEAFEKEFASHTDAKYCVGVGSGFDAILLSLLAENIDNTKTVSILNELHISTTNACSLLGVKPFHRYVPGATLTILVDTPELVYPHINTPYIVDACQAWPLRHDSYSKTCCFSFHPLKRLHCYGDGGAITTNYKSIYDNLLELRNHGRRGKTNLYTFGINSRLDEIQAAVLRVYLRRLR